jgi:hypothetical protein
MKQILFSSSTDNHQTGRFVFCVSRGGGLLVLTVHSCRSKDLRPILHMDPSCSKAELLRLILQLPTILRFYVADFSCPVFDGSFARAEIECSSFNVSFP